ncbi:MAG: ImmA/IrrE family metallo-endopeptidase, partial [Eubacteriales bacterium]
IRKGHMFVMVNSKLPVSKQIFATAHELYHIYCYFQENNSVLLQRGSILEADVLDVETVEVEDMEANAFAALLLAPKERIEEQTAVYNLSYKNITVDVILKIMDIFAIPYKAAVLRLFEEDKIDELMAEKLLCISDEEIKKQVQLTGMAVRWQDVPINLIRFGRLREQMYHADQLDIIRDDRLESDKSYLKEIENYLINAEE